MSAPLIALLVILVVLLAVGFGWALGIVHRAERASALGRPSRQGDSPLPPEAIVIGPTANPVAIITRSDGSAAGRLAPVDLPPAVRESLAPLLHQAPRILIGAAEVAAGATKVMVKFSPEVARGLAAGTLELTNVAKGEGFRAIARDVSTKRFVEHGALVTGVNPVAVAAAVWQVAAIVTAQKFLADINARLANLERGIASIQDLLEDGTRAKLRTAMGRLREMAGAARDQRLAVRELDILAHQIESIDREVQEVTELYAAQLSRGTQEIESQKWDVNWKTDSEVANASRVLGKMAERSATYLYSLEVRVIANMMRGAFGMSSGLAEARIDAVRADLERHKTLMVEFELTVKVKLPTLEATFQREKTDRAHRQAIKGSLRDAIGEATAAREQLASAASAARGLLLTSAAELAAPKELELTLTPDGDILSAARRLPA